MVYIYQHAGDHASGGRVFLCGIQHVRAGGKQGEGAAGQGLCRGASMFLPSFVVTLLLMALFPSLSLWLPSQLGL